MNSAPVFDSGKQNLARVMHKWTYTVKEKGETVPKHVDQFAGFVFVDKAWTDQKARACLLWSSWATKMGILHAELVRDIATDLDLIAAGSHVDETGPLMTGV
jgi:hypothetical protein